MTQVSRRPDDGDGVEEYFAGSQPHSAFIAPAIICDSSYCGKRVFDVACLAIALVPSLFVGGLCALAIRVSSTGPIFFRQERIGLGGRSFRVFKFRSMVHNPQGNPLFPDPNCITPVGRVLRRLSLDELPQLINVARGEMSIVGPRPTLPYQVARYSATQRTRLNVRPGITGLAQVRGRNEISWSERIRHDLEYIRHQSVAMDIRLIARSLLAVFKGSGVEGHPRDDALAKISE
jgi:lipopolysaccharide/colanic/teichoic acid biosynthesis glycosyltransferase